MTDENKNDESKSTKRTVTEEIEGVGNQLIERVQDLVRQGNVRRLIVKTADNKVIIDTTLTLGTLASGVIGLTLGLPFMIIGVLAATVARVKIEVVREITEEDVKTNKKKVEIKDE